MQRISLEEVEERIFSRFDGNITMTDYKKMSDYAHFVCNVCGHNWDDKVSSLLTKTYGCRKCASRILGEKQGIPAEEAYARLLSVHGDSITMRNYKNMNADANFECKKCGYEWTMTPTAVINAGHGCLMCKGDKISDAKRTPIEEVREYIETQNCKLLKWDGYKNNESKLLIEFECGHSKLMSYTCFKDGGVRCAICSAKQSHLAARKPFEEIEKILTDNNLKFVEFPNGYKNQKSHIVYECEFGHRTDRVLISLYRNPNCGECTRIKNSILYRGSNARYWKGGTSELRDGMKKEMVGWRKESMAASGYKCVITGARFDDIHHLYGFNLILLEALSDLGLTEKERFSDYTDDELMSIWNKTKQLHEKYPLGVCLTKDVHTLFHKLYGSGDNTPDQWYEFVDLVNSGQISLN